MRLPVTTLRQVSRLCLSLALGAPHVSLTSLEITPLPVFDCNEALRHLRVVQAYVVL